MKRNYILPVFTEIKIDKSITLVMATGDDPNNIPGDPSFDNKESDKNTSDPFGSPFED